MAKPPPRDDPRVTDLRRYRKARDRARRTPPPRPPGGSLLGSNRYARPILVAVVIGAVLLTFGPLLARLL